MLERIPKLFATPKDGVVAAIAGVVHPNIPKPINQVTIEIFFMIIICEKVKMKYGIKIASYTIYICFLSIVNRLIAYSQPK